MHLGISKRRSAVSYSHVIDPSPPEILFDCSMLITHFSPPNIYRALEMRKSVSAQYDLEQRDHFEQARSSGGQYEGVRQCN